MGFWSGVYKGFSEEEDRRLRREEFQQSLKQRQIETFIALRAKRQAEGDFSEGEYSEMFTIGGAEEPETPEVVDVEPTEVSDEASPVETPEVEAAPAQGVQEGFMPRPTAPVEVPATPTAETTEKAPSKPAEGLPKGVNAKAGALLAMGADKDQIAQIWNLGGEPALAFVLDNLRKNRGNTPYTPEELEEALGSVIITVEKGGKIDDMKLWRELYPDVELTAEEQAYLTATGSRSQPKVSIEMPYFDTTVRADVKPLTPTEEDTLHKSLVSDLVPALYLELRNTREQLNVAREAGDTAAMESAVERIRNLEETVIPQLKENANIGLAMEYLSDEVGLRTFSPYFEKYPSLLENPVFLRQGLGRFADLYKGGGTRKEPAAVATEKVKESDVAWTFTTHEQFKKALAAGAIEPGSVVRIEGKVVRLP